MLSTYKAILRGNHIEWCGDASEHVKPDHAVAVYITILDEPVVTEGQGQRMAAALERLAEINALADVTDPVAWEREMRQDRTLPDREN